MKNFQNILEKSENMTKREKKYEVVDLNSDEVSRKILEDNTEEKNLLDSLAPGNNLGKDSQFYLNTIEDAIKNSQNKNIAITGGYGAGKSTIINTYINNTSTSDDKIIKVSIAKFESKENEEISNAIEKQILQQIIHQIDAKEIPGSRFIRFSELSSWQRWSRLIGLIFLNIVLLDLVFGGLLSGYLTKVLSVELGLLSIIVLIILATLSITIYIYFFTFLFQKFKISKFGIASSHIEFDLNDDSVYFNDYFSDIVYLFKKTKYNIVIFEDLDRFNSIEIFEKLRMLNINLNKSHHLKNNDITFVYALKDDVFSNTDDDSHLVRTKFFDLLIPTINILHTENFKEYMRQTIEAYIEIEEKDKFELLIEDISLFITDMRTLINICNEFKVYQERLKNSKLLDTEILPFIVYKNIYPVDFSRLLRSEGLLFKVFNDEGRYKEELVNQKKILISHGSLIEKKEDILLLFFRRIPRKFINKTIFYNNNAIGSLRDDNQIGIINSLKTIFEFFEKDNENKEIYIKTLAYGETIEVINNKEELFTINRINYLDYYFNMEGNNKVKLDEQLKALDEKLDAISRMSISQLVRDNIISLPEEVQKEELLHYLISHNGMSTVF